MVARGVVRRANLREQQSGEELHTDFGLGVVTETVPMLLPAPL